jgi:hypothetical protein
MAIVYATKTGVWSDTTVWSTGVLPTSADDVYANAFTVSIDQSISVKSLKKIANASPVITLGGAFNVTASATITIADGIQAGDNATNSTSVLNITSGTPTVVVNGNVAGGSSTNRRGISISVSATLTINGDLTGGSFSGTHGIDYGGGGPIITVNGTVTGGSASSVFGINGGASQVTVNGTLSGGSASNAYGVSMSGALRLNADLRFGATGASPFNCTGSRPRLVRGGADLAFTAPSDDDWPLATGADISLTEGGGGDPVDPKRFLNVGGVAVAIQ